MLSDDWPRKDLTWESYDKTRLLWLGEVSLLASRSPANASMGERRVLEPVMIGHRPSGSQTWGMNLGLGCG